MAAFDLEVLDMVRKLLRSPWRLSVLEDRCVPIVSWLGGSGAWEVATNWSGGKVPLTTDDVDISSASPITVTITTNQQITSLTTNDMATVSIDTGALTMAEASKIVGGLTLKASTVTATKGLTLEGKMALEGVSANTFNGTFDNKGTVNHNGDGQFRINGGSTFNNMAGAVYSFNSDGDIGAVSGTNTFNNLGLYRKTAGAATSGITIVFNNTGGTVDAAIGEIDVSITGTWASGTLNAATGATIRTGSHTWSGTFTGTGGGAIFQAETLTVTGATFNFPGTLYQWAGSTTNVTSGVLTNDGQINLTAATGSTFTGTLDNKGTIRHANTGALNLNTGAVLNNMAGAFYTFEADATITTTTGGGTFNNLGTFRKTVGAGTSQINQAFNHTGTVDAQTGRILLSNSGLHEDAKYVTAGGTTIDLGNSTYKGTLTGSGAGLVEIDSGMTIHSAGATLDFLAGQLIWNAGTITATGATLTNKTSITLATAGAHTLNAGTFQNNGQVLHSGTGVLNLNTSVIFNNAIGATYDSAADNTITTTSGGGTFNNAGLFRKTVGVGTSQMTQTFNHTGTVEAQTGRILLPGAGLTEDAKYVAASGTTIDLGSATYKGTLTGSGAGVVEIDTNPVIHSAGVTLDFPAGMLVWNTGTITATGAILTNKTSLTLATSGSRTLNGGTFQNNGTVIHSGAGNLLLNGNVAFNNPVGGIYDLQSDADIATSSLGGTINNSGMFRRTVGAGANIISEPFNNSGGTVEAKVGIIDLVTGTNTGGFYNASAGAEIILANSGTHTGTYTGSGGGTVTIDGLTVGVGGMTLDFPPGYLIMKASVVSLSTNTLTNKNAVTFAQTSSMQLIGGTFQNNGTVTHTGAGNLLLNNNVVFNNPAGSTYDLQSDADIATSSLGGKFNNQGLFRRSVGTGTNTISEPFNNEGGTVDALVGFIDLVQGINTGGTYNASTGAEIRLGNSATHTGTYTGSGGGIVSIDGIMVGATDMKVNFPGGMLRWLSGILSTTGGAFVNQGSLTLAITSTLTMSAVTFSNVGTIIHNGLGNIFLNSNAKLDNQVTGVYDLQTDADISTSFAGGTVVNAGLFKRTGAPGTSTISCGLVTNTGTIQVDAGILNLSIGLTNFSGTTLTGGTYIIAGSFRFSGANIVTNAANITLDGPTSEIANTSAVNALANFATNSGSLTLLNGRVITTPDALANAGTVLIGTGSTLATTKNDYTQSAGLTTVNGLLDPAGTTKVTGGTLGGKGTVDAVTDVSAGAVNPGESPGILTINGNYSQSGGDFAAELNGPIVGTQHDRLVVNGTVALGGQLKASLGYNAPVGDNFIIIANDGMDATTGTFTGISDGGTTVINSVKFKVNYNAGDGNDVVLTRLSTGIGFIVIDDGTAQRSRIRSVTVTFGGLVTLPMNPADAFEMKRTGPGSPMSNVTLAVDTSGSTMTETVAKLTFSGALSEFTSLIDGKYALTVFGGMILDAGSQQLDADGDGMPGGNNVTNFHRFFGDSDGDGTVAANDFIQFRLALGGSSSIFDFDNDGAVAASDFIQYRLRFGGSI